jgi:hypothetical protein
MTHTQSGRARTDLKPFQQISNPNVKRISERLQSLQRYVLFSPLYLADMCAGSSRSDRTVRLATSRVPSVAAGLSLRPAGRGLAPWAVSEYAA